MEKGRTTVNVTSFHYQMCVPRHKWVRPLGYMSDVQNRKENKQLCEYTVAQTYTKSSHYFKKLKIKQTRSIETYYLHYEHELQKAWEH
jgi:hypothetical protein